jgi:hypothetical protein
MKKIDWLSCYTDDHRFDVLSRALTLVINQYFDQNDISHRVHVTLIRGIDEKGKSREYLTIEKEDFDSLIKQASQNTNMIERD